MTGEKDFFAEIVKEAISASAAGDHKKWEKVAALAGGNYPPEAYRECFLEEIIFSKTSAGLLYR